MQILEFGNAPAAQSSGYTFVETLFTTKKKLLEKHAEEDVIFVCGKAVHEELGLFEFEKFERLKPFTVVSYSEVTGMIFKDQVHARDGIHAFAVVAANERADNAVTFVCSITGHLSEGEGIDFPGEGVVDSNTVIEQYDVFGDGGITGAITVINFPENHENTEFA